MPITRNHVAAGGAGLGAAALALASVFIPHWEGMDLTVKHYAVDPPNVYTVCNGITNLDPDYAWIRPGMKFTEAQCGEAFKKVLPKYVAPIAKCIPAYYAMPPHRQVAVLSFAYNVGPAAVCGDKNHSGNIAKEFNAGNAKAACNLMGEYIRANGKVLTGLQNRRFDPKWGEISWCLRED